MSKLRPLALLALLPLLTHCASAPRLEGVEPSHAVPAADSSRLDRAVLDELGTDPGVSGIRLVEQNALAFAYRATSAAAAERTLDVQYYIWHDDLTGKLLAAELMRAAERGVRVRVLVDDMDARAKHDVFLIADQHPQVEVRIFNPFYSRYGAIGKMGEYVLRGSRLTHRMHNKAWIADNRLAIVGGRNIGDEYFGASPHSNFADLDVVMTGPIVTDVSREFDAYWNSVNAVPVSRFDGRKPQPGELEALVDSAEQYRQDAGETPYVAALRDVQQRADLIANAPSPLKVRDIWLLVDEPTKVGTKKSGVEASRVLSGLAATIGGAMREVLVISPYFVPGKEGARSLVADVQRDIRVAVLTNSLAATDVAAVHTGYARYRRDLLRGGVELFEMKRKAGSEEGRQRLSVTGSSGASLHTKAIVVDGRWAFIGSMNLDPRSANLNTEMGVLVDSTELAGQLRQQFELNTSPELSYRVVLEEGEGLVWYDRVKGQERRTENEPDASVLQRLGVTLLRVIPIESQL
jgi:putative cardiolipin synthase